jgi:hypothetical protein
VFVWPLEKGSRCRNNRHCLLWVETISYVKDIGEAYRYLVHVS